MAIIDKNGKEIKYSIEDLKEKANLMRGYNLISLCAAGSGHSGGTLSIMDVAAVLYLGKLRHKPSDPNWADRDRVIWSAGHKAPALYVSLGMSGYFPIEEVVLLRKLYSNFQGHPHWLKLPGIEASTGSLGQGLSISVGIAIAGKLNKKNYRVYCIMGDGEQQEGQIWEAMMEAAQYQLDNLVGIVDKNKLQIDGWVKDVMNVYPLSERYRSFGWNVIEIDGHDIKQILDAFDKAEKVKGKPTVIIADTIKGKGVSFMEGIAGWHGRSPNHEELVQGLKELNLLDKLPVEKLLKKSDDYQKKVEKILDKKMPKFKKNYWWNSQEKMKAEMDPTRKGFGRCLCEMGSDERVVCLGADISDSITISDFYKKNPERKNRFLSMGIAEQSCTCVAAGLAKENKIAVFGSYGVFSAGRNLDQIRTTVCYGGFNVKVVGAHCGVSVGPDGATHQALEDLFQITGLPNINVFVPCDSIETNKATKVMLFDIKGPCYIRFAREATPIVTTEKTPYKFGTANIIRLRGIKDKFIDAFETKLATDYKNEKEDIAIVACGPMVPEAMRAAWILKEEYGLETRVINMHTMKPIDKKAIENAAKDCKVIVTAEEHQVGALGNIVAAFILESGNAVKFGRIGVKDRFGESGFPWELIKEFEVSAEHIAQMAKKLCDKK